MKKKSQLILSLAVLTLFLAACGTSPITESSTGFWDRIVLYNLSQFIIWLSNLLGGSYGLGDYRLYDYYSFNYGSFNALPIPKHA